KAGNVTQQQFVERFATILPEPQGFGPLNGAPGMRPGGPGGALPAAVFSAADSDKDGSLTRADWTATFQKWFADWDTSHSGSLTEESLRNGLVSVLPRGGFGGPGQGAMAGGGFGRRGRGPGMRFGGGGAPINGVELDPLY